MPVSAPDIPSELFDPILSFFRLESGHDGGWIGEYEDDDIPRDLRYDGEKRREWSRCNVTLANKRELGWLTQVCRRWAHLCQPRIFQEVRLRNRDDVESLVVLLAHPTCCIAKYIQKVDLSQSVATYPYLPWVHIIVVRLIPKLRQFRGMKNMTITGPLPAGQSFSSIHGVLPTRYPIFATGIEWLYLKDLHLTSFGHLVQLLKELPSLELVNCEDVTWDNSPDAPLPVATSYVGRDTTHNYITYVMRGCTDNIAAGWLTWLLAPRLSRRLEQEDSNALCRIASGLFEKSDTAWFPVWWWVQSYRMEDCFDFSVGSSFPQFIPKVYVHLTSAVPGERTRRRVQVIHLDFESMPAEELSEVVGFDCWPAIDAQLATLPDLRTVLIQADTHNDLVLLANDIVATKMPQLRDSTRLEYVHGSSRGNYLWYTHDTVDTKDKGRWITFFDLHDLLRAKQHKGPSAR